MLNESAGTGVSIVVVDCGVVKHLSSTRIVKLADRLCGHHFLRIDFATLCQCIQMSVIAWWVLLSRGCCACLYLLAKCILQVVGHRGRVDLSSHIGIVQFIHGPVTACWVAMSHFSLPSAFLTFWNQRDWQPRHQPWVASFLLPRQDTDIASFSSASSSSSFLPDHITCLPWPRYLSPTRNQCLPTVCLVGVAFGYEPKPLSNHPCILHCTFEVSWSLNWRILGSSSPQHDNWRVDKWSTW